MCRSKPIRNSIFNFFKIYSFVETVYNIVVFNKWSINNLKTENKLKSSTEIDTTHYYIRYLPKTEEDIQQLKKDTTLELFDYPLDYEIGEGGTYYHDPSLPDTAITWQYCVVPKDYHFKPIQHEILSDLFIPELLEESHTKSTVGSLNEDFINQLVDEALRITGNLENENNGNKSVNRRRKWTPSGYIKVYDDIKTGLTLLLVQKSEQEDGLQ